MATEPPPPAAPLPTLRAPSWAKVILAVLFFGCLGAGFILTFLGPGGRRTISRIEKRTLAPKPGWPQDVASLGTFPKRCESWIDDHLYAREQMVGLNSFLRVNLLRQSPVDDVIIGQQGWLYYNIGATIKNYRGLERFAPSQLTAMRAILTGRRDWYRRQGVSYVFAVAPDKHTTYPDYLPDRYRRKVREGTLLDQFLTEMARPEGGAAPVAILDLRPAVQRARRDGQAFCRTDTHWNELGARAAAQVIRDWMQAQVPGAHLPPPTGGPPTMTEGPGGDLAVELGLTRTMREVYPHWPLSEEVEQLPYREPGLEAWRPYASWYVRQGSGANLRAIFLHDSYVHMMKFNLAEACQESLFLGRPGRMHFASHALMKRLVETFRPRVIVEEVVERNLGDYFFGDPDMTTELAHFVADQ